MHHYKRPYESENKRVYFAASSCLTNIRIAWLSDGHSYMAYNRHATGLVMSEA